MAKDVTPELAGAGEGDQSLPEVAQREGPAELIDQATRRAPRVHHRHDGPEPRGDLPELGEHRKPPRSPAEGHDAFVYRVAHVFNGTVRNSSRRWWQHIGRRCARASSLAPAGTELSLALGRWCGGKEVDLTLVIDLHAVRFQPLLGVHGRLAAVAGCRDRLAVAVVAHVTGHEDALDLRGRPLGVDGEG